MSTRKPELEDFGITPKDYALYNLKEIQSKHYFMHSRVFVVFAVFVVIFSFLATERLVLAFIVLFPLIMLYGFITWLMLVPRKLERFRLLRGPITSQIKNV